MQQRTVTTLSHECRSLATVLLLATNILKSYTQEIEDPQYLSTLLRVEEAIKQLMQLLDNARLFKQAQTLSPAAQPEQINLKVLCQEIIATAATTATTATTATHPAPPKIAVHDPEKGHNVYHYRAVLEHILRQLLTNAVIYSPSPARVALTIERHHQHVSLKVQD